MYSFVALVECLQHWIVFPFPFPFPFFVSFNHLLSQRRNTRQSRVLAFGVLIINNTIIILVLKKIRGKLGLLFASFGLQLFSFSYSVLFFVIAITQKRCPRDGYIRDS